VQDIIELPPVKSFLSTMAGRKTCLLRVQGNLGDDLIVEGTLQLLSELGVVAGDEPAGADVVLVRGGGHVMVNLYRHTEEMLLGAMKASPDADLVLLPGGYHDCSPAVIDAFRAHPGRVSIYARDLRGYERIKRLPLGRPFAVGIDHDSAFDYERSTRFQRIAKRCRERHILVVERQDVEGRTGAEDRSVSYTGVSPGIKKMIPEKVKRSVKRSVAMRRARGTEFAQRAVGRVLQDLPEYRSRSVFACDLSVPEMFDFESFCRVVADACAVATTRLHVAVLAAMLGKPTYMYDNDSDYQKLKGVYDYSMKDMQHVRLIEKV